jgi:hypothetical protein
VTAHDLLGDLLDRWQNDEARLRTLGQAQLADFSKRYQAELRERWQEYQLEALTLEEAATYSGRSYDTIRKGVASGEILNAGEKGAPRVRRCDLPMKPPGPPIDTTDTDALVAHILAARER